MLKVTRRPVVLCILDGWGLGTPGAHNAIHQAKTPHWDGLCQEYPVLPLQASGEAVGLDAGRLGNSEVGHIHMGAGRVILQTAAQVTHAIQAGDFYQNPALLQAIDHVKQNQSTLHLMGLISDGGVHSLLGHLHALIDLANHHQVPLRVHGFTDGRDVAPGMALEYVRDVEDKLLIQDQHQISTLTGRYYAMDRDNNWERTEKAYHNLVMAKGHTYPLSVHGLERQYVEDVTDEFIPPSVTDFTFQGMNDGDAVIWFNFRADRSRQLLEALTASEFSHFEREKVVQNLHVTTLATVQSDWTLPVAFPKDQVTPTLAQVLSEAGVTQFHVAESEKYAHVTYFFNGGQEEPFAGETRTIIPSPSVDTFDLQPAMHASQVMDAVEAHLEVAQTDFIVCNIANPDMVGHTGNMEAAIEAVEETDRMVGRLVEAAKQRQAIVLFTSDHGNAEQMADADGYMETSHTLNSVPCILVDPLSQYALGCHEEAGLSGIAPTVLALLGVSIPSAMTAASLLQRQPVTTT